MADKARVLVQPAVVPAGAAGANSPAIHAFGHSLSWWADKEMDEEIVYEITKVIYDHADKFEEQAGAQGKFVTKENVPMVPVTEELFHQGALKLYRERGAKPGVK
jgi:TRAP-type uncharacterized transport system substrate-binding protein